MSQWKTMDSAPLDGTVVDLWCKPPHLTGKRYGGGLGKKVGRVNSGLRETGFFWCSTHKCWRKASDTHYVHQADQPAFWMPAEPPPGEWGQL